MKELLLAAALCSAAAPGPSAFSEGPAVAGPSTPTALAQQGLADDLVLAPSGRLIAWDVQSGRGFVLGADPGKTHIEEFHGPATAKLAVSPGQRRAYITGDDRVVEIHDPDGSVHKLDLQEPIGDMAWLDDRRLALSPQDGDHRVEIRDTETGELLQAIEPTSRISDEPGYRPLRSTSLAWDGERQRLHTLDAFTGRYRVFDLASPKGARPLTEVQINDRNRAHYDNQISRINQQLVEHGEFQGPSIWRFSAVLDTGGNAWMVERCEAPPGAPTGTPSTAHLLVVEPDGSPHRLGVETPCCSLKAVPWGDRLAFALAAAPGRTACFGTVARPSLPPRESAWLEVTPLAPPAGAPSRQDRQAPGTLLRLGSETDPASVLAQVMPTDPGLALVCSGGSDRALDCTQAWLDPETSSLKDLLGPARPGRRVEGRVTVEGEGVAGAEVALVPAELRTTRLLTLPLALPEGAQKPVRKVVTTEDGRFTLPTLAPGDYWLLLQLAGGRMDQSTTFTLTPPRRADPQAAVPPLDLGTLDFRAGVQVEVAVTGLDGQPIPGAQAGAAQEPPPETGEAAPPGGAVLYTATASDTGRAVLEGLAPGLALVVTCRAPGYDGWQETFDTPPSFVACTLDPLSGITGQVVDQDGEPLPGARITLTGGSPSFAGSVETASSDREGRFRFDDLEAGRFRVTATIPGRTAATRSLALETGDAEDLGRLVLEPGTRWAHRVVEAATGEPVAGATLTAMTPPGALLPATTDAWGEVELEGPASGPLTLEVRADGFAPRRVEVPESARTLDTDPQEIALERGGWIVAHVWDEANDAPCAGCRIGLSGAGPPQALVTDGTGTARSEPLAPGPWNATLARLQGFGAVVRRSGGNDVRQVQVRPGATSELRFGDPHETLEVVLSPPPTEPGAWRLIVRDTSGAVRAYPLDRSGSATIRRPTGGAVLLLTGDRVIIDIGTLSEDAADPTLVERPSGLLTAHLAPDADLAGALRLELVNLATGSRTAEIEATRGGELRVPFLAGGVYELRAAGRRLATATVIDGQETGLGEVE